MRVLAIAAHPDDEILGVGGTLLRHKAAGDTVRVLLAYRCRVDDDEVKRARDRMGLEYSWYIKDLAHWVDAYKPDTVYTHSSADLHAEHRELHERVLIATRPDSGVKTLYAFETPSATDWGPRPFIPTHFVDIGETMTQKLHAMEAYASELRPHPHPRNLESLTSRAEYWGQRVGVGHAEAFEVIRSCWS